MRTPFVSIVLLAVYAGGSVAQTAADTVTLAQAVDEAVAHNPDLAAERLNISVAETRAITARLRPNPVLTVSGQTLDALGAGFNPASPVGPNQFNIHTDFPLERGGKRESRMAVAEADRELAELSVREFMRQVIFEVENAFVIVQQAKDNLALAQDNRRSLQAIVEINQAKVKSGELAAVELERSHVAALQYDTAVEQAFLTLEQAKARLQLLMGRKATAGFEVTGPMRRDTQAPGSETVLQRALVNRPDVLGLDQAQARSTADLRLQVANGKVDFVVGSEYTYQRAYGFGGNTLGFSLSTPLPFFNRNQGEIARAQRELQQVAARRLALEARIGAEVESAYRQYTTSQRLLENIETNMLTRARSVREVTEYSYRRGEASLVEFLDAQRAFNDAMQSYNEARANYARSLYQIDSISGASVASLTAAAGVSKP